jgi:methionyl aminopeptidase
MTTCSGVGCEKEAGTLKCPTCLKHGIQSYFCDQECFKKSWATHKQLHPVAVHDPFPEHVYTGKLRAQYPLKPRRKVDDSIQKPDYAIDGIPYSEQRLGRTTAIKILNADEIEKMRTVNKLGREVLDIAGAMMKPGVSTEDIDDAVFDACMQRGIYPSPLNYYGFPKSTPISVNEVVCHGIPDKRKLEDGDIVNIDISVYKDGFHSDLNETYYCGEKAKQDSDTVRLVETTREALDLAIQAIKPGMLFRDFGDIIEKHAKKNGVSVVRSFVAHGVNDLFHGPPNIPHYAKNKAIGVCKPGMTFTLEPMLNLGSYRDQMWPDNWTAVTVS